MGETPSYQMTALAISSHRGMHTSSCNVEAARQSFDTFIKHRAAGSGIGDVMGSQALQDTTTPKELESVRVLANEQVAIARHFGTKFSNTAFTLLKKVHEAFIATGEIAQKFVDDMATAGLNFICDATAYEEELSSWDGIVFAAGLAHIRNQIAELIREASELKGGIRGVPEEVRRGPQAGRRGGWEVSRNPVYGRLHRIHGRKLQQPPVVFELVQHLALHSSCGGHGGHASCLADFPVGEHVSLSLEDIPLAA